jgi:hypothetical protein
LYFSSVTAEVEATVLQPLAHHPYHSSEKWVFDLSIETIADELSALSNSEVNKTSITQQQQPSNVRVTGI